MAIFIDFYFRIHPFFLLRHRELSDVTRDGQLNVNEFIVACKLIQMKLRGYNIPPILPAPLLELVTPTES